MQIEVRRGADSNSGNLSFSLFTFIGALPFGNTYSTIADIFSSISYVVNGSTFDTFSYPASKKDQEYQYGKVIRYCKTSLDSNGYLSTESQRLYLSFKAIPPIDIVPKVIGYRDVYNKIHFEIYSRHPVWLTYSVLEATVDKIITKNYYIQ